jgi:hypothetical protein
MTELDSAVDRELDHMLALWAAEHRLGEFEVVAMRAHVSSLAAQPLDQEPLDAEWLWSLLRPVTALLDRLSDDTSVFYLPLA